MQPDIVNFATAYLSFQLVLTDIMSAGDVFFPINRSGRSRLGRTEAVWSSKTSPCACWNLNDCGLSCKLKKRKYLSCFTIASVNNPIFNAKCSLMFSNKYFWEVCFVAVFIQGCILILPVISFSVEIMRQKSLDLSSCLSLKAVELNKKITLILFNIIPQ